MDIKAARTLLASTLVAIKSAGFMVVYEDQLGVKVEQPRNDIFVDAQTGKHEIRNHNGDVVGNQG